MRSKRNKLARNLFPIALALILVSGQAFGADSYFRRRPSNYRLLDRPSAHNLATGGAISAPSESALFGENPAGLIFLRAPKLLGLVASGAHGYPEDLLSNGIAVMAGDGLAAAGLGVQTYSNSKDSNGSITLFNFGLGTYAEPLNLAIGLNGAYRFKGEGKDLPPELQKTWTANFGVLYNPEGDLKLGLTLFDIAEGVDAYGAGLALDINSASTLSVDASVNDSGRGLTLKPSLSVQAASLQLMYGFGVRMDKSATTTGLSAGNTLGIGFEFNPSFRLEAYYNQTSLYSLSASIGF